MTVALLAEKQDEPVPFTDWLFLYQPLLDELNRPYLFADNPDTFNRLMRIDYDHLWTLCASEGQRIIRAGYHVGNPLTGTDRLGFFVTEKPWSHPGIRVQEVRL